MMKAILVSAILWTTGCALDESGELEPAQDSETAQAATVTPPPSLTTPLPPPITPSAPTSLRRYLVTNPQLYPLGIKSAYTVVWPDPADNRKFLAVGYDVRAYKTKFFVSGDIATDFALLHSKISDGIQRNVISNSLFKGGYGMASALGRPCCRPPTPRPENAWPIAQGISQAVGSTYLPPI